MVLLNLGNFSSLVFWFLVCFITLTLFFRLFVYKGMKNIFEKRAQKIKKQKLTLDQLDFQKENLLIHYQKLVDTIESEVTQSIRLSISNLEQEKQAKILEIQTQNKKEQTHKKREDQQTSLEPSQDFVQDMSKLFLDKISRELQARS